MKQLKKCLLFCLAALFLLLSLPLSVLGAEIFPIESIDKGYQGPKDTPLLVLLVNFDPSLNGEDMEDGEMLLRHTDHSYWSELLFGDDPKGLKSYFEIQSDGNFRFTPAKENYVNEEKNNRANDGIVEVSVTTRMYPSTSQSTSDPERNGALRAAIDNGYIDLEEYDTNGDKRVDESELVIAFIAAGYESTRSGKTPSYNAHASNLTFSVNGVFLSTGYIKVGEMMNNGPLSVGSFCHELGHVLGNGDLYAAGASAGASWGGSNAPAGDSYTGGLSIMAGTGSSGHNSGEPSGTTPSNYDPYHLTVYGFYDYTSVGNGEYTLYSRQSEEGKYNIIKVSTPNPSEYYLIENRYFDDETVHFDSDTNRVGTRGILIWHVDQKLADTGRSGSGMRINTPGHNKDIGVAALAPAKEGDNRNPASPGVFNTEGLVFDCKAYQFPGSGTWHTSLTEEQAASFGLKIEILDNAGHEMRIKITGAYEQAAPRLNYQQTASHDSIHCDVEITDLNTQILYGIKMEISDNQEFTSVLQTYDITPDSKGKFSVDFTGLAERTKYYIRIVYDTQHGTIYDVKQCETTVFIPEDTTSYEVSFYRDPGIVAKPYRLTFKVGEAIAPSFPMNKIGYVFAGWYADKEFTEYYDITVAKQDHQDLSLYAKWVKTEDAAKLTVVGASLLYPKADPAGYAEIGDTFQEPLIAQGTEAFLGWYADPAFTIPFDFTKEVTSNAEVKIYAKWESDVSETTTASTTTETTTVSTETTTEETTAADQTTDVNIIPILIVGVIVVCGAVAAAIVLVIKKKKK